MKGEKMSVFQFTNEFNKRASPKNTDGSILKFSRNKGYESIPRAFAQNGMVTLFLIKIIKCKNQVLVI